MTLILIDGHKAVSDFKETQALRMHITLYRPSSIPYGLHLM